MKKRGIPIHPLLKTEYKFKYKKKNIKITYTFNIQYVLYSDNLKHDTLIHNKLCIAMIYTAYYYIDMYTRLRFGSDKKTIFAKHKFLSLKWFICTVRINQNNIQFEGYYTSTAKRTIAVLQSAQMFAHIKEFFEF